MYTFNISEKVLLKLKKLEKIKQCQVKVAFSDDLLFRKSEIRNP